jgi:ABC-2 type transport system ATP-binding protein
MSDDTQGTQPAVTFDGVGKAFDDEWVLEDLSFSVPRGSIIGLIGPSGSGKTTTVRLMTGAYRPDAGTVDVLGADPVARRRHDRSMIGYLPQQPVLFDELSLWENLNFHASLNGVGLRRKQRLLDVLELVELDGHRKKLVRESSGGMQRRLALASTLVHAPNLVMLDEPTAGIDPILRRRFWEHFRALSDAGDTLVISTQFVDEATHCDTVGLLADGRLVAVGAPDELRRQAHGGDLIDVEYTRIVGSDDLRSCRDIAGVQRADYHGDATVRLVVDPDSDARSRVFDSLVTTDPDISGAVEIAPDWDDVFIRLVESDTAEPTPGQVAS